MLHNVVFSLILFACGCRGLVPKPVQLILRPDVYYVLADTLEYVHDYARCDLLHDALRRFDKRLKLVSVPLLEIPAQSTLSILRRLSVHVEVGCDESAGQMLWPSNLMDEQYIVDVSDETIAISGNEIWGILHGLETVLQLIYRNQYRVPVIQSQLIIDQPRYPHRGYLIDTSRHYLDVELILKFLDAMSMVKMNVLHWHIVDETSFPYYSHTYPNLTLKGAYDAQAYIYTRNDVNRVLHHARGRGIRVMAEFDTPGHTRCWGNGHPELLTQCYDKQGDPTGELGPVDPTKISTYAFMRHLMNEVKQVFPESYIHLGGDEVDFECWASNPNVTDFMQKMQFGKNYSQLQSYYMAELIKLTREMENEKEITPVVWQEVFDEGFRADNRTVIHVWKDRYREEIGNITAAGFPVLFSSCWYLNYIRYGRDWIDHYNCDPADFGGTPDQIALIRGGEAAMWGEYVDRTNIFSRSWPRGAAVAERLWSTGPLSATEFRPRLEELRCRMLNRGWKVEPLNGPGYCKP